MNRAVICKGHFKYEISKADIMSLRTCFTYTLNFLNSCAIQFTVISDQLLLKHIRAALPFRYNYFCNLLMVVDVCSVVNNSVESEIRILDLIINLAKFDEETNCLSKWLKLHEPQFNYSRSNKLCMLCKVRSK